MPQAAIGKPILLKVIWGLLFLYVISLLRMMRELKCGIANVLYLPRSITRPMIYDH